MLQYHETASNTIKAIAKFKGSPPADQIQNALEMIKCKVMYGSKVDQEKLIQLLSQVYYVKVGVLPNEDSKLELPSLVESGINASIKMYEEDIVEKIQSERDYYQRREEELQHKLREMQLSRKGTNIR